ncbi:MAG TPA: hypothetical protein VFV33_04535, partial [Gemmatimonadaceae bacterium]|nr:hypothetical protein [Gemmatimonadaceae bacterium]
MTRFAIPARLTALAAALVTLATPHSAAAQETKADSLFSVEKYLDYEQVADAQISPDGSQIV